VTPVRPSLTPGPPTPVPAGKARPLTARPGNLPGQRSRPRRRVHEPLSYDRPVLPEATRKVATERAAMQTGPVRKQIRTRPTLGSRSVVFFDVDGTLVPETSSSQFLAERLVHHGELRIVEDDYAAGRVDNHAVAELDARGYLGATPEAVARWLEDLPVVDGVQAVFLWCWEHDVVPILATLAWSPVGEYLCRRFGFAGSCGPALAVDRGWFTGFVDQNFSEYGKLEFARTKGDRMGFAACSVRRRG
jgi:phosphoserine phosphatase